MIRKIDTNSEEFKEEFELTKKFTNSVLEKYNLVFNPDEELNRSIQMGLTRNKLIYGKTYCPCFMLVENEEENRLCPCKPALEKEIPQSGMCHCGIFCTKEKNKEISSSKKDEEENIDIETLSKQECENILAQDEVNSNELEALLKARKQNITEFLLVDTREWMEWFEARIEGTDYLVPTTSFYNALEQITDKKDKTIILYCYSGSRSAYCQRIMLKMGFSKVLNFDHGIMSYMGDNVISGE
ncbi:ferredoxin-thioredoxin reductase catalytic domain-containing protein [Arcobacter porcinus]|uniref:Molybdopterin biosynthesis-like protein MoeZ n=1 Tax=Arcobacter porcinus TaxID=1935204 RepID=A0ABX2YAA7_9BACT|nr:ferredoxin-thioredoxin reductase catalytic domain-containing protein [Arcobacter porcinus]OCL81979.1 molybdopterin biosynthesis-like protein MoeZ [Arcobacter porcinus]OCL82055.1 molybdopterin biosynthesis-like protein MoeZ [Arcobacter porcinus]OCL86174.1 molybdopterin biosynthesis-like protein MoeZ [Arcobacter porcinus]OCL90313.1 molybdopterin biosynthesis-like protein MoeZ [Arcobacter porcinus]